MNREFENSGREMPYRIPPQSLEALHERILSRTSAARHHLPGPSADTA